MTEARVAPVLARIVAGRRAWIAGVDPAARARLGAQAQAAPPARDFRGALERPGVSLIAECKARSPSAGTLQDPYDPVTLARRYEAAGASALSVLTEPDFFGGAFEHLRAVRAAVAMPLLCKDFVVDELLVTCARAAGADAALLIVAILDDAQLHSLHAAIRAAGMQALIEAHTEAELERALEIPGAMIGINNRDLSTMRTDPGTTARLRPRIPPDRFVVSESGIRSAAEIDALAALGVGAALVGESLLRAPDLEAQMRRLRR
ncbi:MAG TPA: indole-3-glycerol phosphate synthase TrpC [Candidatus Limnocylindrales bacterium]|nr:indole-3-glycerol phosphate synthase TrpC [Candidatus Limnocylindrales bacterium]